MLAKKVLALPLVAALSALPLAGCTDQDAAAINAIVNTACVAAGVGSQIAINVVTGNAAQTITSTIGADVTKSCGLLIPAVQTIVGNITQAGQTAKVTVSSTNPATKARRAMHFKAKKAMDGSVTYVFPPQSQIPFLNALGF